MPLLARLLYPKMRKRSGRLGGKGAPGSARAAILNYLAALDPAELAPLVHLFLQPVSAVFRQEAPATALLQEDAASASQDRYVLVSMFHKLQACKHWQTKIADEYKL